MRRHKTICALFTTTIIAGLLIIAGCGGSKSTPPTPTTPKIITVNYIELSKIDSISRFRSSVGHDYSDAFESCRSMKHYFKPRGDADWSRVRIYAPLAGTITQLSADSGAGTQVHIQSGDFPSYTVIIFHVNFPVMPSVGDHVNAGQLLGVHIGPQTYSDIAVSLAATGGNQLVSYFDVMTDSIFQKYQARGLASRTDAVISKQARDNDPLTCNGDSFTSTGSLANWVPVYSGMVDPADFFPIDTANRWYYFSRGGNNHIVRTISDDTVIAGLHCRKVLRGGITEEAWSVDSSGFYTHLLLNIYRPEPPLAIPFTLKVDSAYFYNSNVFWTQNDSTFSAPFSGTLVYKGFTTDSVRAGKFSDCIKIHYLPDGDTPYDEIYARHVGLLDNGDLTLDSALVGGVWYR
jgi:hypothetical protein